MTLGIATNSHSSTIPVSIATATASATTQCHIIHTVDLFRFHFYSQLYDLTFNLISFSCPFLSSTLSTLSTCRYFLVAHVYVHVFWMALFMLKIRNGYRLQYFSFTTDLQSQHKFRIVQKFKTQLNSRRFVAKQKVEQFNNFIASWTPPFRWFRFAFSACSLSLSPLFHTQMNCFALPYYSVHSKTATILASDTNVVNPIYFTFPCVSMLK